MPDIQIVNEDVAIIQVGNGSPLILTLKDTVIAERSIDFIRNASPLTFPDLITVFTMGIAELTKAIGLAKTALVKIDHQLEYLRADLLINHVPLLAKAKGLKPTVSEGEALITLDPQYRALSLLKEELVNSIDGLEAKFKAIDKAYFAVTAVAKMKFGTGFQLNPDPGIPEDGQMGTIRRRNQFRSEF